LYLFLIWFTPCTHYYCIVAVIAIVIVIASALLSHRCRCLSITVTAPRTRHLVLSITSLQTRVLRYEAFITLSLLTPLLFFSLLPPILPSSHFLASVLQCSPPTCDQLNKKKPIANASIKAPGILTHRNLGRSGCGQLFTLSLSTCISFIFPLASVLQCSPPTCDQLNKKKPIANASIKAPGILTHRNLGRSGCGQLLPPCSIDYYGYCFLFFVFLYCHYYSIF
jgi:hypothetical protein